MRASQIVWALLLLTILVGRDRASAGFVSLGDLPGGRFHSVASGVSADGSTVVGYSIIDESGTRVEAFLWTQATGMVGLGFLTGDSVNGGARGGAGDGSAVVGFNQSPLHNLEACHWTSTTDMVSLGDLPGDGFQSIANAVSVNGSVIVGQGESSLGLEAFRWTADAGMIGLGKI